jgi:hypothetical protein
MEMMLHPQPLHFVRGDTTRLAIPAHHEALRTAGEAFLTDALRTFGSISPQNRITRITRLEPFRGGNSGEKVLLTVEYQYPELALHTELFVKFSRDFTDAFRDRRRHELEAEVRVAPSRLSDSGARRLFCGFPPRIRHRHSHHAVHRFRPRQHRAAPSEMPGP